MGEMIGLVAVVLIFGTPIAAILSNHQRKVLELKLRLRQQVDANVLSEIAEVKRQVVELRDTTTRYDVGFDTALQRIEARVGGVEQRVGRLEAGEQTTSIRS